MAPAPVAPAPVAPAPVAPAPPSPDLLAYQIYNRLKGNLPRPQVVTNPEPGEASIIHVPVFLEVTNWQETFVDSQCVSILCLTVTATPQLTFVPGEPESGRILCEGGGDRYNPTGGSLEDQAAGACAHSYERRTSAEGRPDAWPGQAEVDWTIAWEANTGESGVLPSVTLTEDVPRPVHEVQVVLVEDGGGR